MPKESENQKKKTSADISVHRASSMGLPLAHLADPKKKESDKIQSQNRGISAHRRLELRPEARGKSPQPKGKQDPRQDCPSQIAPALSSLLIGFCHFYPLSKDNLPPAYISF
jgi:hypothetical protein